MASRILEYRFVYCDSELKNVRKILDITKEFPKEQELREKAARLQELNSLLNMDQQNSAILDAVTVEDVPEKEISLTR